MECSKGLQNITLREYQMQALFWMLQREKGVVDEAGSAVANANANDGNLWEKHPVR